MKPREILKVIEDENLESAITERGETVKVGGHMVGRLELARLKKAQHDVDATEATAKKAEPAAPKTPKPQPDKGPSYEELGEILKAAGQKVPASKKNRQAAVKALQAGKAVESAPGEGEKAQEGGEGTEAKAQTNP